MKRAPARRRAVTALVAVVTGTAAIPAGAVGAPAAAPAPGSEVSR